MSEVILKIKRSIFTKLLIVIIISGLLVNFIAGAFFRHFIAKNIHMSYSKNVDFYADYIIKDLGFPPSFEKALDISGRTSINISIRGKNISWSTSREEFDFDEIERSGKFHGTPFVRCHSRFFLIKNFNGYKYFFYRKVLGPFEGNEWHLVLLVVLLSAILGAVYIAIRKILKPIKLLSRGVKEISGGNMDYNVPVIKMDELGELSRSFNSMREQIKYMLHAKKQLLIDVSHELRTPLTRIKLALEFIPDNNLRSSMGDDISEIELMIDEIIETERLDSESGKLKKIKFDILPLIKDAAQSLDIEGEVDIENKSMHTIVNADRERFKKVIKNILENAKKYSRPGEHSIKVALSSSPDLFEIIISDAGTGIPENDLPYVFEPFYRVDPSRTRESGGYGLGLSLCRKIMEAHSGTIDIKNRSDKGLDVILRLPLVE